MVSVGQFCLEDAGTFSMSIHIRQRPALEPSKRGIHGKSYDVVIVNFSGSGAKNVSIDNWVNTGFALFDFARENEDIRIKAQGCDWTFDVTVASPSLQNCSTYIE